MLKRERLAAMAAVASAIATGGPIAVAGAATPIPGATNLLLPVRLPTLPVPLVPCSGGNGLLPGLATPGPAGPLGLPGLQVPRPAGKHHPCRVGVFMK